MSVGPASAGAAPPVGAAAGVVLAAGSGSRMGGPKALLDLGGRRALPRAAAVLRDGGCDPVGVVLGAGREAAAELLDLAVAVVVNDRWADGMATSVATGLRWAQTTGAGAVVVLPVDTPGIGPAVVSRVIGAWRSDGADASAVVVATYDGAPRNPVLIGLGRAEEVARGLRGDVGARGWIAEHPDAVRAVECGDVGDPADLDTPADLSRWTGDRTARGGTPS